MSENFYDWMIILDVIALSIIKAIRGQAGSESEDTRCSATNHTDLEFLFVVLTLWHTVITAVDSYLKMCKRVKNIFIHIFYKSKNI